MEESLPALHLESYLPEGGHPASPKNIQNREGLTQKIKWELEYIHIYPGYLLEIHYEFTDTKEIPNNY